MTVTEARRQIWLLRTIGFVFSAIGGVVCITSLIKHVEAVSAQDYLITKIFGKLIDAIVGLAYVVLWPFWEIAPDISMPPPFSMDHLVTSGNIWFGIFYIILLAGIACRNRASVIAKRVAEAREEIRMEALRRSMGGAYSAILRPMELRCSFTYLAAKDGLARSTHSTLRHSSSPSLYTNSA